MIKNGVVIAVAIGIAAAAGYYAQQKLRPAAAQVAPAADATPATPASITAAAAAEGQPAAAEPAPLKVPDTLPWIELMDRDGKKRALREWSGKPLMVNFWATWCGPCRREIPLLNQIRKQRAGQGLEIVGIAVDFRDDVLEYATKTAIDYPLLIGEEEGLAAVKAMGQQPAFPFTAFADSKQRLVYLKVGELHQEDADLILDRVVAVDAGKLDLARAQQQITEGLKETAIRRAQAQKP